MLVMALRERWRPDYMCGVGTPFVVVGASWLVNSLLYIRLIHNWVVGAE